MRNEQKLIIQCIEAMQEKLGENSHKPDWKNISLQELVRLADKENIELKMALYIYEKNLCDRLSALKELRREAADNVNFYAMIIEKCNDEIKRLSDVTEEN